VRVPIAAAKRLAEAYGQSQVIIVTWDKHRGVQQVATYGVSLTDSTQAAQGGNRVKVALGWPESLCAAEPARVKRARVRKAARDDGGAP
jgi:hypothetical protein